MTQMKTSIRLDRKLVAEAAEVLGTKSFAAAVRVALTEVVAMKRFKSLMAKHAGQLVFSGHDEGTRLLAAKTRLK